MKNTKFSIATLFFAAFCLNTSCGTADNREPLPSHLAEKNSVKIDAPERTDKEEKKTKSQKSKDALVLVGATVAGAATAVTAPKAIPYMGKTLHATLDSISKYRKLPRAILNRSDTQKIVAWAQPLDNKSDDIIHLNGKALTSSLHQAQRVDLFAFVSSAGKRTIFKSDKLLIKTTKNAFTIEVTPLEKDVVGRLAPVVIAGTIPKSLPTDYIGTRQDLILDEIRRFLFSINRSIAKTEMQAIKSWLADLGP